MNYWLLKSEPSTWSWQDQIKAGPQGTHWDGVRNFLAAKHMRSMKIGDKAFFYHSVNEKCIVGIVEVVKEFYPDPLASNDKFVLVDVAATMHATHPLSLHTIKQEEALSDMVLVNNSRLSVQPVTKEQWNHIVTRIKPVPV